MEAFPPKFSNVLVTPDPQYIPGYAGYCPQLKFTLGETYGKLTAQILSSPEVSSTRQLILYNSNAPSGETEAEAGPPAEVWGSLPGVRRHPERMIPGYKGFIPKSRNCFSRTYSQTCREALSEFQRDLQKRKRLSASADLPRVDYGTAPKPTLGPYSTPLTPITKESVPYKTPAPWKPLGSPYTMEENNPNKYFISGFTGYVPKSRFLFGTGFPITTNRALVQFDKEARGKDGVQPPSVEEFPPITTIYPSYSGMVPAYTGHVPGYRFSFGQTFGQLTHNALGSISAPKGR
ncbi:protein FAM166B [Anguilla anguilla]|uniref:protein FAM166B n=1 Tax=Anguilla anguilla TaxID=7936 RepID=UPI0015ABAC9B|nr:protein FAM166B [Anguilla anguilla]